MIMSQMKSPAGPSRELPDVYIVEPKLEPDKDSPPAPQDQETTPLSGDRPFFTAIMARTYVQRPYQLVIPAHFHRRLPARRTAAVLLCGGRSWIMRYCGDTKLKRFDAAWGDFAVDNGLLVGDACVFELVSGGDVEGEELVFEVQVLRSGGMPGERATKGAMPGERATKGATTDEPIIIIH